MAKVTITIEDNDKGDAEVYMKFDPPMKRDEGKLSVKNLTHAQVLGLFVMKKLNDEGQPDEIKVS